MIKPLKDFIQIRTDEVKVGSLNTSGRASAVEFGEVIAIGPDQTHIKVGDNIFFKSWGLDNVFHNDKWYRFINPETGAILAIVEEEIMRDYKI